MKKILKRIVVSIIAVYAISSLFFNLYRIIEVKPELKNRTFSNTIKEEKLSIPENTSIHELTDLNIKTNVYEENLTQIKIFGISSFIGILIGLLLSLKENKNVKLILLIIVGNVVFNILVTSSTYYIFYTNGVSLSFSLLYLENTLKTMIPYIIACAIIYGVQLIYNKKIKEKK